MANSKKKKGYSISPYAQARNIDALTQKTGNVYESIVIVARRSNQIGMALKEELHSKLNEFASNTDSLEEIHENKEQIEISKFYERMPHPTLLAMDEFMNDEVHFRKADKEKKVARKK